MADRLPPRNMFSAEDYEKLAAAVELAPADDDDDYPDDDEYASEFDAYSGRWSPYPVRDDAQDEYDEYIHRMGYEYDMSKIPNAEHREFAEWTNARFEAVVVRGEEDPADDEDSDEDNDE